MRVLSLMLTGFLLLASFGCAAQKITLEQLQLAPVQTEPPAASRYSETLRQMSDELLAGAWLSGFNRQQDRKPYLLIVFSDAEKGNTAAGTELKELITGILLDSGKLNLVMPKENLDGFSMPLDQQASSRLRSECGADFLLLCSFLDYDESGLRFDLLDLVTAELVYSKAIINHIIKT